MGGEMSILGNRSESNQYTLISNTLHPTLNLI